MDALLSSLDPSPVIDDVSDDALAARALHDPEAFTIPTAPSALAVFRYCPQAPGPGSRGRDLGNLINAYSGLRGFGSKPFRPWLFAIAHNVVVDAQRKRWRLLSLDDVLP